VAADVLGEGKTVEEALEDAARKLGTDPDQLEYEVVQQPTKGLLGVGAKPAVVRIASEPAPLEYLGHVLSTTARLMGFDVAVDLREDGDLLFAELTPDDSPGLLVGRGGECLQALQHLSARMLGMRLGSKPRVVLDIAGYRKRRSDALARKARRLADQVRSTGREVTLDPLWAADRRVIHLALKDDPTVTTQAYGEGPYKRITIAPADGGTHGAVPRERTSRR
jgi:spoIIIJ-associated protein